MFNRKRIENTVHVVDQIIHLCGIKENSNILDLACGPGRHVLEFARRNHNVTGVDPTKFYLDKAREAAVQQGLSVRFVQSYMRNFIQNKEFDLILNLFSSFGCFDDPQDDIDVLQNMYNSLKSGGFVLLDMVGKEVLARVFQ